MQKVPKIRIAAKNAIPVKKDGKLVLYWMIAYRRLRYNFALDRAIEWATELQKPLVILEALRVGYPWASERFHQFILDGMEEHEKTLAPYPGVYYPYVEEKEGEGKGLLEELSSTACVIVTDQFPCFFLPAMVEKAAKTVTCRLEAVDSNGLLPLATADRAFTAAVQFRRFLQREVRAHLEPFPRARPLRSIQGGIRPNVAKPVLRRWPKAEVKRLTKGGLRFLPIDHEVQATALRGGEESARQVLKRFLALHFSAYGQRRNDPDEDHTSGLSPFLHFGQISSHEVFERVAKREAWRMDRMSPKANGKRQGFWGMRATAEAFLDQILTWRELGFHFCSQRMDYDAFSSLPDWAQKTLLEHARDHRPWVYELSQFERAQTHDPLWNAAQRQLVTEGKIHNYLRMLWGKKILEWTRSPQEALAIMIELNNRYALDGRDPNSYSGISWTLGRYDHPWPPERPIFGTVRYMSSESTRRKIHVHGYLQKYAG